MLTINRDAASTMEDTNSVSRPVTRMPALVRSNDRAIHPFHFGCPSTPTSSESRACIITNIMNAPTQPAMLPYNNAAIPLLAMVMAGLMMIGMIAMRAIPTLTAATAVVFASLHTQRSSTVRALLGFIVQPPRLRGVSGRMPLGAPGGLWRVESQAYSRSSLVADELPLR